MATFMYSYNPHSESAKLLSKAMGIKRIASVNSKFVGDEDKVVINWGSSKVSDEVAKCRVINNPAAVNRAANKIHTFMALDDVGGIIPPWTADSDRAREWIGEGETVVERHVLNGNSGDGIRLVDTQDELDEDCPLYVMYIPKKSEFRVHVVNGIIVDVQRKCRRKDVPDEVVNWKIRNHDNGFIFARNEDLGIVPRSVLSRSALAVNALGLDFGAVDVIYNEKYGAAYVLEINTAPGLSGTTLETYTRAIQQLINKERITEWDEALVAAAPKIPAEQAGLVKADIDRAMLEALRHPLNIRAERNPRIVDVQPIGGR